MSALSPDLSPELPAEAIAARFAWAKRNGHAHWLWPDIAVADWQRALAEIVAATRAILAGRTARLAMEDSAAIGLAAYTACMGPLLGHWIAEGRLDAPEQVKQILAAHLDHNRARMATLTKAAMTVSAGLAAAGLHPMILKGMHTAFAYFPDPALRPVSDIDIHLPPEEIGAADPVLRALGYLPQRVMQAPYMCDWIRPQTRRVPLSLTWLHRDDPWGLDVQASLDRRLTTGRHVALNHLSAERTAWPVSSDAAAAGQPLLALLLAAHLSQELRNVTLLRVCELVLVLRQDIPARLTWEALAAGAEKIGGLRYIYPALYFCDQLAPALIAPALLAAARADAPSRMRKVLDRLTLETAPPLARHAVSEKLMWIEDWRTALRQFAYHLGWSGQPRALADMPAGLRNKFWILLRGRVRA